MKLLCIDQAATISGYSYWEDDKPIKWGVITPIPKNLKDGPRLTSLRDQFQELIRMFRPNIVVIEDPVGGQEDKVGPENNWKTMQTLCQLQGILIQIIHSEGYKIDIISPSSWQATCGIHKRDRTARKEGAVKFVEKEYKLFDLPQDVVDSICIGYHFLNKQKEKEEISAF